MCIRDSHEIAGNTEQAVVAQIVETVESPFRVFFLHLAQVASDFLLDVYKRQFHNTYFLIVIPKN